MVTMVAPIIVVGGVNDEFAGMLQSKKVEVVASDHAKILGGPKMHGAVPARDQAKDDIPPCNLVFLQGSTQEDAIDQDLMHFKFYNECIRVGSTRKETCVSVLKDVFDNWSFPAGCAQLRSIVLLHDAHVAHVAHVAQVAHDPKAKPINQQANKPCSFDMISPKPDLDFTHDKSYMRKFLMDACRNSKFHHDACENMLVEIFDDAWAVPGSCEEMEDAALAYVDHAQFVGQSLLQRSRGGEMASSDLNAAVQGKGGDVVGDAGDTLNGIFSSDLKDINGWH